MVYTYTPAYYSTFQDSIASICKSILPFSFKKRGLPAAAERKLSKQQTDNLKWQQESFHQILNLMGLHKEGILPESEVCHCKSQLLETLVASKGTEYEQPVILRDKLLFLQELLYAKCISDEEYHASKRPLLQRLAVQGAEIEARDVIPGSSQKGSSSDEEWSVIDLKDEHCLINKDGSANSKSRFKSGSSAIKHIKGAATVLGFGGSSQKQGKNRAQKSIFDQLGSNGTPNRNPVGARDDQTGQLVHNPSKSGSFLMSEGSVLEPDNKVKKKGFMGLFNKEERDEVNGDDECSRNEEGGKKSGKKQWGFDGFKKSNRRDSEDETAPLPLNERSDYDGTCLKTSNLVARPIGEGPDTRQIKKKLHSDGSASDFFIDKVLGDNIKKELTRIQAELSSTNTNLQFSNDEMETISTKLPVDKADLQKFFPKSWCDRHGEVVLDVVKKEFKGHVREMESSRHTTRERRNSNKASRWATFDDYDDNENSHPNLFSNTTKHPGSTNPFLDEDDDNENKLQTQSFSNPFWNPSSFGSSLMH